MADLKKETTTEVTEAPVVQEAVSKLVSVDCMNYKFVNLSVKQSDGSFKDMHFGPGKVNVDADTAEDLQRRVQECIRSDFERINGADKTMGHAGHIG